MSFNHSAPASCLLAEPAQLAAFYRQNLLSDVIPFWFPRSIDAQCGGYLHCLDADGSVVDSDKSVWAQGRMAWMLLTLNNWFQPEPEWFAWGSHGIDFIDRYCTDPSDGHMYFHLDRQGRPLRKRRYAYSEAFASIASAAMFRATKQQRYFDQAEKLFDYFLHWNFTPGVMPPKFTATRPMTSIGPRMIALVTAQTLRQDLGPNSKYQSWIDRLVEEIECMFVKDDWQAVMENVAPDGSIVDHFDGRVLNPGHAIEAAWFILEEAAFRNDKSMIDLGCRMLDYSWQRGWDAQYGGLYYFRDLMDRPVQEYWHDMKFWWPHDEAIIATLMAFQLTGSPKYALWHHQVHQWSFQHFADKEHGEWFGYLHRDGSPSNTLKGSLWKSFFHHPRMLWKCWQKLTNQTIA